MLEVMQGILLTVALGLGLWITWFDSRPNWDDTGITAAAILIVCGLLGAWSPRRPWLWALAVGLWIPLWGIARHHNWGALLALAIAFGGAYAGMALRRLSSRRPA